MTRVTSFLLGSVLSILSMNAFAEVQFGPIVTTDGVYKAHYESRGGYYITEGDILVEPVTTRESDLKAVARHAGRWKNAVVPFVIDSSIPSPYRVEDAILYFNTKTHIRMIPRTTERDYVFFKANGPADCSSSVGRVGGKQVIHVSDWCGRGSLLHEILHALGYYHEQSRPDRRKWIKVKWSNIHLKRWFNFFVAPFAKKYGPFDFDSIMLYPSFNGFGKDPSRPTIIKRDGSTFDAQRRELSAGDFAALKQMYPVPTVGTAPTKADDQKN